MRITWDDGERLYSQGVSQGVLYPQNSPGVPWNGLLSVVEKGDPSPTIQYLDGIAYNNHFVPAVFDGTLSAITYPDEFEIYDGVINGVTAQNRLSFGLSYCDNRELHIIYNAFAAPSNDQYQSVSDSPNAVAFSWVISTLPMDIPGARPTSHLIISLDLTDTAALGLLQAALYGDDENDPYLPQPADVIEMFESSTTIRITDNGNGTWSATGPDELVFVTGDVFTIVSPTAIFNDETSYTISSSN